MKLRRILHTDSPSPTHTHTVRRSDGERRTLRRLLGSGSASARTLAPARLLLKAAAAGPAWTDIAMGAACAVSLATIARVRRAFGTGGLDAALHRKPTTRPYHRTLDGRQEAPRVALSCTTPPPGPARWSLCLLTERVVELEGTVVSDETVRRVLKRTAARPG